MDYFERIITHYLIAALKQDGVIVDSDTYAELKGAFEDMTEGIRALIREEMRKANQDRGPQWPQG